MPLRPTPRCASRVRARRHRIGRFLAVALLLALPVPGTGQRSEAPARAPVELVAGPSIGCTSCAGPERFGTIEGLSVDGEGRIYVADGEGPHLRVFGPAGASLLTALPEGEGPGEARSIHGVALLTGGRIAALDYLTRRVTVLDERGSLLETHRVEGFPQGIYGAPDRAGFWTIETNFRAPETFAFWPSETLTPAQVRPNMEGTGLEASELAFRFFAAAAGPGGRFAIGDGEVAYRIRVVGRDGERLYDAERQIPRRAKSVEQIEAERAERASAMHRLMARQGADNPEGSALSADVDIDPLYRYFLVDDLAFDEGGRLWVRRPGGDDGRTAFDLFSPTGRFLGEVEVEGRVSRFAVGGGVLVAALLDELDVATVRVWEIRADSASSA